MMGSAAEIREWILRSGLMTAHLADEWIARWNQTSARGSRVDDLVAWLVAQNALSDFHGDALSAGHFGPYLVGPYRVFERIAAGRLGTLFRAVHVEFDQPVTLKVFSRELNKSPEKLARMGREARVSIEVDHPNVVRTYHVGESAGVTYLAIEDLRGEMLATRLARENRLPLAAACWIVQQAALGLEHVHSQGIVHRDIQPANIWLSTSGAVKIMEFGAARDALDYLDSSGPEGAPTMMDVIVGTYDYMSPEQAQDAHTADARSDVYSLGCTLYHCLTGQPPFRDKNPVRQMLRHANEAPKPVSDLVPNLPLEIVDTVQAMIAKRPDQRYRRAADVARVLAPFAEPENVPPDDDPLSPEFKQWLQSAEGHASTGSTTAATSPEGAEFLRWLETEYGTAR